MWIGIKASNLVLSKLASLIFTWVYLQCVLWKWFGWYLFSCLCSKGYIEPFSRKGRYYVYKLYSCCVNNGEVWWLYIVLTYGSFNWKKNNCRHKSIKNVSKNKLDIFNGWDSVRIATPPPPTLLADLSAK